MANSTAETIPKDTQPSSEQAAAPAASAGDSLASLQAKFETLRAASRAAPYPSLATRRARLDALQDILLTHQDEIVAAAQADFGCRSKDETRITEVMMILSSLRFTRSHLRRWMKPRRRAVALEFQPGRAKVLPQPLGVVGIMAPWNYPFQLIFVPLISTLAAGNRALLKPSEMTPHCATLIARLCAEAFDPAVVDVALGGPKIGQGFSALPFDHLVYTGSTAVGRLVAKAAAPNLTPLTLELGGKSPVILHPSFPVEAAAARIAFGKAFNGGQTCIAADYVFVDRSRRDALAKAIEAQWRSFYPTLLENSDFTSVVNEHHYQRVQGLLDDARAKGAQVIEVKPEGEDFSGAAHRMPLHLLLDVTDDMKVMQEEIFGPLLPILSYDSLDEVSKYISERPRPLALYYFDRNRTRVRKLLEETTAGMVSVNDVLTHAVIETLPFGGVGASGTGAYHGLYGFDRFSHHKAVFTQSRFHVLNFMNPPYGKFVRSFLRFMIR